MVPFSPFFKINKIFSIFSIQQSSMIAHNLWDESPCWSPTAILLLLSVQACSQSYLISFSLNSLHLFSTISWMSYCWFGLIYAIKTRENEILKIFLEFLINEHLTKIRKLTKSFPRHNSPSSSIARLHKLHTRFGAWNAASACFCTAITIFWKIIQLSRVAFTKTINFWRRYISTYKK